MGTANPFVDAVCAALSSGLAPDGFVRVPALDRCVDGVCFTSWRRDCGWKDELIEVSHPRVAPDHVLVHLRIELPCPPASRTGLAGTTAADVIGGRGRHWFPNLFGWPLEWRASRFATRVLSDTRRALPWFDGYATPEGCLARLNQGETPWGLSKGPSFRALAVYLAERRSGG